MATEKTPTPTTLSVEACKEIKTTLGANFVSLPGEARYKKERKRYWSVALRQMRPACIITPNSVADVAAAIKVLAKYPHVPIAVRSGGHDPNPGNASTDGGVLLSLTDIKGATYNKETGLVHVRPGGNWNDVIKDLEPHGVTIVGGRLGTVGVGGYLLQGGLSFLSAQYGLGADNIVGWEVVTGDGSIVQVDAEKQPELAVAMRGSGSQFGIITEFRVKAYPVGTVWGGMRLVSGSKREVLHDLLHKFIPHEDKDPKAAIICTEIKFGKLPYFVLHLFYDGPEPPTTGLFAEIVKIPAFVDQTATQTYTQLLFNNGKGTYTIPYRCSFRSLTLPYIPSRPGMYQEITDKLTELNNKCPRAYLRQVSCTFQPFPKAIGQQSAARGGNAMGLGPACTDRIVLENSCNWLSSKDDAVMAKLTREFLGWVEAQVPLWLAEAGMPLEGYMPAFMNDAGTDQAVTASYRDYEKLKKLQEAFDTTGMFRNRVGGHKY